MWPGRTSRAPQKIEQFGLLIDPMNRFNRWCEAGRGIVRKQTTRTVR